MLGWTPVLMAVKGFTDPQTLQVAERAEALCEEFGAIDRLVPVLFGRLSYYSAGGEIVPALDIAARIWQRGEEHKDELALMVGKRARGFCLVWMGQPCAARDALVDALARAESINQEGIALRFGHDLRTTATATLGWVERRLGAVRHGTQLCERAMAEAVRLGHPLTLAHVLYMDLLSASMLEDFSRVRASERQAGAGLRCLRDPPVGEYYCLSASLGAGEDQSGSG